MKSYLQNHICSAGEKCDFINQSLEIRLEEYRRLGAVPHCCFSELSHQHVIVAVAPQANEELTLYASACAFFEDFVSSTSHSHVCLTHFFASLTDRPALVLRGRGDLSVRIPPLESAKLIEQTLNSTKAMDEDRSEDLEVEDGQSMIFSTPDPELPGGFIDYLQAVFNPITDVAEVFVFESSREGDANTNLVVGVVLARSLSRHESDKFSFLLLEGVEQYLAEREVIDFMVIEDSQLREIVASVSPEINLTR